MINNIEIEDENNKKIKLNERRKPATNFTAITNELTVIF